MTVSCGGAPPVAVSGGGCYNDSGSGNGGGADGGGMYCLVFETPTDALRFCHATQVRQRVGKGWEVVAVAVVVVSVVVVVVVQPGVLQVRPACQ